MAHVFTVTRQNQRSGSLMLLLTVVLLGSALLIVTNLWAQQRLMALLGLLACGGCATLAGWLALRDLWPRRLEVDAQGGVFSALGRPGIRWAWTDAVNIEWRRASSSRFAPEEPWLILRNGRTVPLDPFGPTAYQAVRERMLLGSIGSVDTAHP